MLNNKWPLVAIVILIVAAIVWKRSGPAIEKKQIRVVSDRNFELRLRSEDIRRSKACDGVDDKPKCFVEFVGRNGGIRHMTDLGLYNATALSICAKDLDCYLDAIDRILPLVDPEKVKSVLGSDVVSEKSSKFQDVYNIQLKFGASYLNRHRDHLLTIQKRDPSKTEISHYLSNIDAKIKSWPP